MGETRRGWCYWFVLLSAGADLVDVPTNERIEQCRFLNGPMDPLTFQSQNTCTNNKD